MSAASPFLGVTLICSGGQRGADMAGLAAALTLGIPTGGWTPKGFRTERGKEPWLAELGIREHSSWAYPPRTRLNANWGDGTFLIGNPSTPGSRLTLRYAKQAEKPTYNVIATRAGSPEVRQAVIDRHVEPFRKWILQHGIRTLNVAGNRESVTPGITHLTHDLLVAALSST